MPGLILALSLIQVMLLSGLTVSREREEGSFDMMLMTPASSWEIYLGKGLPAIFVGIMQALIIFSVSCFWFEIPFAGSFATLLLVITLFSAAVVGLGLAISAVCRTIQQSMVAAFLCILPAIILSGLMTPVRAMPEWMQTVTIMNPLRYSIDAVRRIYFEGATFTDVLPLLWPVVLIWLVVTPLALKLFRAKIA